MNETSEMNGRSTRLVVRPIVVEKGKSPKTKGARRGRGELQLLVGAILARRPDATPQFVAEQIGISAQNARMSIRRYQNNVKKVLKKEAAMATKTKKSRAKKQFIKPGSAAARVFEMNASAEMMGQSPHEKHFVALITLIGLNRAAVIVTSMQASAGRALQEIES